MKNIYFLLVFTVSFFGYGQSSWDDFTGEEKAFFYHTARRMDILKPELFHLFEFKDSIPMINDTLPDYRYIEHQVVNDSSKLGWHFTEVERKSDGILADLALRYAIWELDAILHFRNSTDEADAPLKEKLRRFEKYVLEKVPQKAVRTLNNGDYVLVESLQGYYSPSLTIADKLAAIINSGYNQLDQMLILNAIMQAEEKYVNQRTGEVFKALGGNEAGMKDFISAVGDGANWAEIVGGIKTPYDQGLPDEKGLFKFTIEEVLDKETEKNELKIKSIERKQLITDPVKETVVHTDVFGYHEERQTTVVVQKGGNSYVLYGKNDQRLLSPDSTYGEGTTYWRLMYTLEHHYIANLKEDLYGKRGYEYQIDLYENKIEKTRLQIKQTEYRLNELRHTPEGKPKMKKKKLKKKNLGVSDQAGTGHPTSELSKLDKKKNIEQNRLVQLNGQLDAQKDILEKLKEEMEKAYETLIKYEAKLDFMKKTMGYIIMEYEEEENGFYRFKDGALFDYNMQDFIFPATGSAESFQVLHISFGGEVFTDRIEENFIHLNVSNRKVREKYTLRRIIDYRNSSQMSASDSIQVMELFQHLLKKGNKPVLTVYAGGIGEENKGSYTRSTASNVVDYNADNYADKTAIIYRADQATELNLSVTVYGGQMKPAEFSNYAAAYVKIKGKYPKINEIDFYSGVLAKAKAESWKAELMKLNSAWTKNLVDRAMIASKLKKLKVKKVVFLNGEFTAKVPQL